MTYKVTGDKLTTHGTRHCRLSGYTQNNTVSKANYRSSSYSIHIKLIKGHIKSIIMCVVL